ncbi:hypothetical protein Bbelb_076210 [Branchiostoma belcheri]|nr:hypothetical protein Bbelb_076210 [Branchiostoma belcheri]
MARQLEWRDHEVRALSANQLTEDTEKILYRNARLNARLWWPFDWDGCPSLAVNGDYGRLDKGQKRARTPQTPGTPSELSVFDGVRAFLKAFGRRFRRATGRAAGRAAGRAPGRAPGRGRATLGTAQVGSKRRIRRPDGSLGGAQSLWTF